MIVKACVQISNKGDILNFSSVHSKPASNTAVYIEFDIEIPDEYFEIPCFTATCKLPSIESGESEVQIWLAQKGDSRGKGAEKEREERDALPF